MTDTNEDTFKVIKNKDRKYAIANDRAWVTIEKDDFHWLIQEVERLRRLRISDNMIDALRKESFEILWKDYPEKKGKHEAWLKFKNQVKTPGDLANISKALENYKADMAEVRKNHPDRCWMYGSTWFNHRWEDYMDYKLPDIKPPVQQNTEWTKQFDGTDIICPEKLKELITAYNKKLQDIRRI